jgi:hypothetical protein
MTRKISPNKTQVIKKYDGDNAPEGFDFPNIGIEQIDRAVFDLFENELNIQTTSQGEAKKVPVIFATGERFALTRRKNPIRDKNNTNILPLISILRQNLDIGPRQGGKGTAISFRAQPNYTIKYRLSESDRNYQNLVNKQGLKNQDNVSSSKNFIDSENKLTAEPGKVASRRKENIQFSKSGKINLHQNVNNNIFEIIQTPYPYFIAITYDIVFWAQYMQQGNQMIEYFLNKIRVPGGELPFKTKEGYELVAFVDDNISFNNNFDQLTSEERIIKYNFSITVPGYLLNTKISGVPAGLRSYYSAPVIDFSYNTTQGKIGNNYRQEDKEERIEKHVLTDVMSDNELSLIRGENPIQEKLFIENPFLEDEQNEFLRIKSSNARTGESVISGRIIKEIDRQYE